MRTVQCTVMQTVLMFSSTTNFRTFPFESRPDPLPHFRNALHFQETCELMRCSLNAFFRGEYFITLVS